ncbi:uncharacterized protein LOC106478093 [Limulus polyphemus]|uniref:Uncharacterized protein LOC106478093 n=1 Tax=Limulus polyphemus TaxID=6850 RepID=A0ABM1C4N0_LIMPO|nr:uncharacterized protein LOC106478093 [Limulus polyphemus]
MYRWVVLALFFSVVAAGDYFATGLGTLDPNYSQKLGADGQVHLDFRQKKNGFSYSVSDAGSPNGANQQQTSISKDALGGHTIQHAAHGLQTNPYTGSTNIKHSEHAFHINPYLGKAAVHSNDAAGHLSPLTASAAYQQNNYDAQIAPGLSALQKGQAAASISPYGNHASHAVHNAHAAAVPGGVAHAAHTAQAVHANHPGLGGYTQAHAADVQGFQGPGYGALTQAAQNTGASYGPYGLAAQVKQDGYAADNVYNAHINYAAGNQHAFAHHAHRDPYSGYQQVTHTANTAHESPIYPSHYAGATSYVQGGYAPVPHASHGYVQGGYAPVQHASHGYVQGGYAPVQHASHGYVQGGYAPVQHASHGYANVAYGSVPETYPYGHKK